MAAAWGAFPDTGRIGELMRWERPWTLDAAQQPGPLAGKTLTGADIFWLAAHTLAGPTGDLHAAVARLQAAQRDNLLRVSLDLGKLDLRGAVMSGADLRGAILGHAHLEGVVLGVAMLEGAFLGGACLNGASLDQAQLAGAYLGKAHLDGASLYATHLERANLTDATLNDAILQSATLDGADLAGAQLASADLTRASLAGASLAGATLPGAVLYEAHLERASLKGATLTGADLRRTTFDATSRLNDATLEHATLYQASFDRTSLSVVDWRAVRRLGDELIAKSGRTSEVRYKGGKREVERGGRKTPKQREKEYIAAARAYRSLSVELRAQGIVKDATRFHFRAEVMSRRVSLHRAVGRLRTLPWALIAPLLFLPWLLSLLLSVVAGYGVYHVWRLAITYLVVVGAFAGAYWLIGAQTGLQPVDAVVLSLTSFHGRGLPPSGDLTDLMRAIAGAEAVLGLLIEGLFIAAFTRRITGL